MTEIRVATHIPPIDWTGVPASFHEKLSAVCRTAEECNDLVRWFGSADFCPLLPVMVVVPGAHTPALIAGFGYASAAELRDCALVVWHNQTEQIALTGGTFDYDARRERAGLMRREDVDPAIRQALVDRIAKHKANPVTDPFRQPIYPNPTNRKIFERK